MKQDVNGTFGKRLSFTHEVRVFPENKYLDHLERRVSYVTGPLMNVTRCDGPWFNGDYGGLLIQFDRLRLAFKEETLFLPSYIYLRRREKAFSRNFPTALFSLILDNILKLGGSRNVRLTGEDI